MRMKHTMIATLAAAMLMGSLFVSAAVADEWTGYVSDAKCGKTHNDGSAKSIKCVQACVKMGQAPVLVVGDSIYKIDDSTKNKVMEHLGHKVTVTGKLSGETITIETVKMVD